jgi:hypothetical protein
MNDILVVSTAVNLAYFAAAVLVHFLALRLLDRLGGIRFKVVLVALQRDPLAAAVYFSARFIGIALLASALVK